MVRFIERTEQLLVELSVRDLMRSVTFYRALGFDLLREEKRFAALVWEGHQLFLQQTDNLPEPAGPTVVNLRVMVPDVDRHWQRAIELGPRVIVPIGDRHYGLRDFTILDPDGFELRFATRLPEVDAHARAGGGDVPRTPPRGLPPWSADWVG
jgi:catechol 2,3-dioxygenase-like lactoylglutathione lyase family enzyme